VLPLTRHEFGHLLIVSRSEAQNCAGPLRACTQVFYVLVFKLLPKVLPKRCGSSAGKRLRQRIAESDLPAFSHAVIQPSVEEGTTSQSPHRRLYVMGLPQDLGMADMPSDSNLPYPAETKQAVGEINGVVTDVMSVSFSDRIMVTITQGGRLAQWVILFATH
jgi:hypothetical protein